MNSGQSPCFSENSVGKNVEVAGRQHSAIPLVLVKKIESGNFERYLVRGVVNYPYVTQKPNHTKEST